MSNRRTALSLLADTRIDADAAEIETNLERIALLATEAAQAGDLEAVACCRRALDGDAEAYLEALEMLV